MINVQLNGDVCPLNGVTTLNDFLQQHTAVEHTFAVAVNQQFVPKAHYAQFELTDGDCVELVVPMQGG